MSKELIKYNEVFKSIFNVDDDKITELEYKIYPEWNSISQIALISALEEEFAINFEADDIFTLTSYKDGLKLMKSRFGIDF